MSTGELATKIAQNEENSEKMVHRLKVSVHKVEKSRWPFVRKQRYIDDVNAVLKDNWNMKMAMGMATTALVQWRSVLERIEQKGGKQGRWAGITLAAFPKPKPCEHKTGGHYKNGKPVCGDCGVEVPTPSKS